MTDTPNTSADVPEGLDGLIEANVIAGTDDHPTINRAGLLGDLAQFLVDRATQQRSLSVSGVRVKPLEWKPAEGAMADVRWIGEPPVGARYVLTWSFHGQRGEQWGWNESQFRTLDDAKAAAQADYKQRILSAIEPQPPAAPDSERTEPVAWTAEQRQTLASVFHDLTENAREVDREIKEQPPYQGKYPLTWARVSWTRDMNARAAERIEEIIGTVCRECEGSGIVKNPDARYERDRDTGFMETNDPEEIECPRCDGNSLEPKPASVEPEKEIAF